MPGWDLVDLMPWRAILRIIISTPSFYLLNIFNAWIKPGYHHPSPFQPDCGDEGGLQHDEHGIAKANTRTMTEAFPVSRMVMTVICKDIVGLQISKV